MAETTHRRPDALGPREPLDQGAVPAEAEAGCRYEVRLPLDEKASQRELVRVAWCSVALTVPCVLCLRWLTARFPAASLTRWLLWAAIGCLLLALFNRISSQTKESTGRWLRAALFCVAVLVPLGLLRSGRAPAAATTLLFVAVAASYAAKKTVAQAFVWWMTAGRLIDLRTRDKVRSEWSSPGDADLLGAFLAAVALNRAAGMNALFAFAFSLCVARAVRMRAPALAGAWVAWRALQVFLGYDTANLRTLTVFQLPLPAWLRDRPSGRRWVLSAPVLCWAIVLVTSVPFPAFTGLRSVIAIGAYCALPAAVFFLILWLTEV